MFPYSNLQAETLAYFRKNQQACFVNKALLLSDVILLQDIANTVGVTDNTVRSQVKTIFSKTGVRRQGELIHLLLAGTTEPSESPC